MLVIQIGRAFELLSQREPGEQLGAGDLWLAKESIAPFGAVR